MALIACGTCHKTYPQNTNPFQCECGGVYDFLEFPEFRSELPSKESLGMWKYRNLFGLQQGAIEISLGEGNTSLLAIEHENQKVFLKMESHNPTGSYKDRGTSVLVSCLKSRGVSFAVEDSSGNAGASFAAYCAKAGIKARVYVPESASGPKRTQIEMYGAELVRVPGLRVEAAKAVLEAARSGAVYASHAYMPFGLAGIASIAYEIEEQLGNVPGTVIAPVGHGGLLYGIMRGFEAMRKSGYITREPYYIGVQSKGCAPLAEAYRKLSFETNSVDQAETLAEGVKVTRPIRGTDILKRISLGSGKIIAIDELELISSYKNLALLGIYAEPTSALAWAAVNYLDGKNPGPVVAVITGSGYKSNLNL